MRPLNLQDVYCVSNQRHLADDAMLESLARRCGKLPDGYAELVTTLGFGTLDDLRILKPDETAQSTTFLRESLQMCAEFAEEFDSPLGFPDSSLEDAIPLAGTDWGDYYFCSPSAPGVLWYLNRPHDWEGTATFLPLGFQHPFCHQDIEGSRDCREDISMVFHPDRPVEFVQFLVDGKTPESQGEKSVPALVELLKERYEATHLESTSYVDSIYVKPLGAEFRVGYRHQMNKAFLIATVDADQASELAALKEFIAAAGFEVSDHP